MCGIVGEFNKSRSKSLIAATLQHMTDVIKHRGPDDEGFYVEDGLGLGMRRLSIIDLSSGQQPVYNEDKSIVLVFNGEIYNYVELREDLIKRGHQLYTNSDTEVIVHLYEDYGDECVRHLRGMFGFALWDIPKQRLLVVRDRLGIKPIYYTPVSQGVIFASEIKSLLLHPEITAQPDLQSLSNFLSLKYVPAPQTMFENIRVLPPGYRLICDVNGFRIEQYWDISFANQFPATVNEDELVEELEYILNEAVRLHLRADVPFGAFLSGGIDSSTIVALMSRYLNEPVKTFSVGYSGKGSEYSELPYARIVAEKYHCTHHEILLGAEDLIELMPKVVWHLDQPIADQAALANFMVSRLARQHVKMVLTGEGGDELFAGYARYVGENLSPFFNVMPQSVKSLAVNLSQHLPGLRRQKLALYALSHPDEVKRLTNWFPLLNPDAKALLLSDTVKSRIDEADAYYIFAQQLSKTDAQDVLSRMLYVDTKLWLPDDLLARGDKTSMANSLEARIPILDHHLVEFAARVPSKYKVNGLQRKYLLRKFSSKLLPEAIINRKKQGFPMPVSLWFRETAQEFVHDTLSVSRIQQRGLYEPQSVIQLLKEHDSGFADHGTIIWSLMNIELWYQQFIDEPVSVS